MCSDHSDSPQPVDHMLTCPLCGCSVNQNPGVYEDKRSLLESIGHHGVAFYAHINNPRWCCANVPRCPHCSKDFTDYSGASWLKFAKHWLKYGHMDQEAHCIAAALGGLPDE